jgi:hypothetical protein
MFQQQAMTTPVGKLALVGAALLALGTYKAVTHSPSATYRLSLSAPVEPNAIYLTRWELGSVTATFDDGTLEPITFKTRAHVYDGCYWQGTETLVPINDTQFAYDYSEQILSCEPDAVPLRKTPRRGVVTAEQL